MSFRGPTIFRGVIVFCVNLFRETEAQVLSRIVNLVSIFDKDLLFVIHLPLKNRQLLLLYLMHFQKSFASRAVQGFKRARCEAGTVGGIV